MAKYIECEAFIAHIRNEAKGLRTKMPMDLVIEGVANEAKKFPAADVQPVRHGRWIETTQPMGWDDVTCAEYSECGEDFVLDEWGMDDMKNLMLYCPKCGAKMDKEIE